MHRGLRAFAVAAVLVLAVAPVALAAEQFTASLSGENSVPPLEVDGTGNATVTISDDAQTVSWEITYSGLTGDPAAGHIHFGAEGANGPVMIPFASVTPTGSSGSFNAADYEGGDGLPADWDGVLEAIRDGNSYVNIHTAQNQGGEIRGQLRGTPATDTELVGSTPGAQPATLLLAAAVIFGLLVAIRRFAVRSSS